MNFEYHKDAKKIAQNTFELNVFFFSTLIPSNVCMGSPTDAPITRNISGYPSFAADWATHPPRPTRRVRQIQFLKMFWFHCFVFYCMQSPLPDEESFHKLTILMTTHAKYQSFQRAQKWTEGRCEGKEVKRPKSFQLLALSLKISSGGCHLFCWLLKYTAQSPFPGFIEIGEGNRVIKIQGDFSLTLPSSVPK